MIKIKDLLYTFFTKKVFAKIVAYLLIFIFFYVFSDFVGLFLLIFIFSYLFFSFWVYLKWKLDSLINKFILNSKKRKLLKKFIPLNWIIILLYVLFVSLLAFIISDLVPKLIFELWELNKTVPFISDQVNYIKNTLEEVKTFNTEIWWSLTEAFSGKNIDVIMSFLANLKSVSVVFLQFFLALVLSFVFVIDRVKLQKYLKWIKNSSFSFLYSEYKIIFDKIIKSFWLILKAQATIASINAILTIIWLTVIWLIHGWSFPYLLTLWLLVFISWFIPVLWVFISSIPILFIAYTMIWGTGVIIEILLLVAIIHMIEAYYLNPKIVSSFLELPVSLTFIILIMSEHLFWVAGLLIWISIFYFTVWLLRDFDKSLKKNKREIIKKSEL